MCFNKKELRYIQYHGYLIVFNFVGTERKAFDGKMACILMGGGGKTTERQGLPWLQNLMSEKRHIETLVVFFQVFCRTERENARCTLAVFNVCEWIFLFSLFVWLQQLCDFVPSRRHVDRWPLSSQFSAAVLILAFVLGFLFCAGEIKRLLMYEVFVSYSNCSHHSEENKLKSYIVHVHSRDTILGNPVNSQVWLMLSWV